MIRCAGLRPVSDNRPTSNDTPSSDNSPINEEISNSSSEINDEMRFRNNIIDFSEKYLDSKYKYGGTTPKGFDCSGYTFFVMNEFNIKLPHNSAAQSQLGKKIKVEKAQPGDLIFFSHENNNNINHVGIVYSNENGVLKMIHASSSKGIRIDSILDNGYWAPRLRYARNVVN